MEELRALLEELPLDEEQRASVGVHVGLLSDDDRADLLASLQGTLASLGETTKEIGGLLVSLDVQVTRDEVPARAFAMALCDPA